MIDIIASVVHHVAHLLERSRVRVVGNRAVRIRFMRRSGRRACVSGSRVYVSKRERERERERKENASTNRAGLRYSNRSATAARSAIYNCTFRPAAADSGSIRRKQVHHATTEGERRGEEERRRGSCRSDVTPWVQAISFDHYPVCAFPMPEREQKKLDAWRTRRTRARSSRSKGRTRYAVKGAHSAVILSE